MSPTHRALAAILVLMAIAPGQRASSSVMRSTPAPDRVRLREVSVALFDGEGHHYDGGYALALSPQETHLYVTGTTDLLGNGEDGSWETLAYDARTSALLWSAPYGILGQVDAPYGIAVSPDGNRVYVTGYTNQGGGDLATQDSATVAYDAMTGEELWAATFDGPGESQDTSFAVAVSPDGDTVVVTGQALNTQQGFRGTAATIAYDALTGDQLWASAQPGMAWYLALSGDGDIVVGGQTETGSLVEDYLFVSYDLATGAVLWSTSHESGDRVNDSLRALTVSPDGTRVYASGLGIRDDRWANAPILKINGITGAVEDSTEFRSRLGGTEYPADITVTASATLVVAGTGISASDDWVTISYDAHSLTRLWEANYDTPWQGTDAVGAIAADDAGNVFVTGIISDPVGQTDYWTVLYRGSTGRALAAARYAGPTGGNDYARALAATRDGRRAYVTGEAWGEESASDFATVSYEVIRRAGQASSQTP